MKATLHLPRPHWNASFMTELCVLAAVAIGSVFALCSLGMQNINAQYWYEGQDAVQTTIPFSVPARGEYFEVHVSFDVNTLHASRFVVGPDDCVETASVNGEEVEGIQGICNKYPGRRISLSNLHAGTNDFVIRIHDTGGEGGLALRVSWLDPLVLTFSILLLLAITWIAVRLVLLVTSSTEIALLPIVLAIAFVLRLALAWHGGFGGDIHLNQEWSKSAVEYGIVESYTTQVDPEIMMPNYPPLSIMMFAATGHLYKTFVSPDFNEDAPAYHILIKLPAIIADLLTVLVLFALLLPMGSKRSAFLAATLYAVHPAVFHDSSVWGQVDAVFTLFLCLTLLAMQRNRWLLAGITMAAAILLKMQSVILVPVVIVAAAFNLRRWIKLIIGGLIVTVPTLLPFVLAQSIEKVTDIYLNSVGYYSSLSSNAYNMWVMLYGRETGKSATDLLFGIIENRTFGIALWLIVIASVTLGWAPAIARDLKLRGKTGVVILSGALIAYSFFLFNAEMHERYLFPYMALGLPLVMTGRKGLILYLLTSVLFFLNLESLVAIGEWDRKLIQEELLDTHPVVIATLQIVVFFLTWRYLHTYQLANGGKRIGLLLHSLWTEIRSRTALPR